MKIELSYKELGMFKEVQDTVVDGINAVSDETDGATPGAESDDLLKQFTKSKALNVSLGVTGVTVEVKEEYLEDYFRLYKKLVVAGASVVISTIKSIKAMAETLKEDVFSFTEKWS